MINQTNGKKNKIYKLLDDNFIVNLFKDKILPQYPEFTGLKQIKIQLIKNNIWTSTYHVVIEYRTVFSGVKNKLKTKLIYCTAHSGEPRLNSFEALTFLWQNGFNRSNLTIPKPLFYSAEFNGFFYEGLSGQNLYHYIRQKDLAAVESIVIKAAGWFAKLHGLNAVALKAKNFNPLNSRVKTIIPGMTQTLAKIQTLYPGYFSACRLIYETISRQEENFFSSTERRWLIHGDAHPENIISINKNKIGVIDFTDLCLADYARDLGTFLQQLEFMMQRKINDQSRLKEIKRLFLTSYLKNAKLTLDAELQKRIDNYYSWTAFRTAIFFLLRDKAEPERAHGLLVKISQDLGLAVII